MTAELPVNAGGQQVGTLRISTPGGGGHAQESFLTDVNRAIA
ncbi:MAG: hypothetical protein R3C44_11060 [Chloroflexota bacterium]